MIVQTLVAEASVQALAPSFLSTLIAAPVIKLLGVGRSMISILTSWIEP